jgi:cell division protein FtsI/penicillin-binding protein 2
MNVFYKYRLTALVGLLLLFAGVGLSSFFQTPKSQHFLDQSRLDRVSVAKVLLPYLQNSSWLPQEIVYSSDYSSNEQPSTRLHLKYTLDEQLQKSADTLLKRYKPDYAAIFMMDAKTGKVLIYSSFQKEETNENLLKKATYPAASIFKIITATAAVEKRGLSPQHKIQFNGGNWTLYKKNVMLDTINRWTRTVSMREAFAKSMNTPFGKIGLHHTNPQDLQHYAERFMFNQSIPADFPVDKGVAQIPTEKNFELTEVAAGFNKQNRMSPIQGAMIAAAVINDGKMMAPYMVESVTNHENKVLYTGEAVPLPTAMTPASSKKIRELMEETILSGTSRRTFASLRTNKKFRELELGGKTGHLTGLDPKGQVDWFVGFASNGERDIAIGVVTVNKKFWTVKSSYLGQSLFQKAFEEDYEIANNP